jgi:hypothetical protein
MFFASQNGLSRNLRENIGLITKESVQIEKAGRNWHCQSSAHV